MMKVLLVDDEIFTIRMLQTLIPWEKLGMTVAGYAQSGEEGYEKTIREHPDIIISDIRMPGMSGLEFLGKVRRFDERIKLILMSAYADFSYIKEGMKLGCSDYILKPVDENELEQVLGKVAAQIRGEQKRRETVAKSERQLDRFQLYRYMCTGKHRRMSGQEGLWQRQGMDGYVLFLMQLDSSTIDEYDDSANMEMGQEGYITRLLEELLKKRGIENIVFDYEEGSWIILAQSREESREAMAGELIEGMRELTGIRTSVCFGERGSSMEELPELYEQVKDLSKYSFYVGEGEIFGYGYNCTRQDLEKVRQIDESRSRKEEKPVGGMPRMVREGMELVEKRYEENLSLDEICEEIAVSKNYFCYLFKRETKMSFWNYLTSVRLRHAKRLLEETDLKSYEIALKVGYDNPSYFSKLFKKYEGISPNEYRRVISGQNIVADRETER